MSDLPERVEQSIGRRGLLRRGEYVLVAVSGGLDSMVLLHVLRKLSRKNSWRLAVAHLNHRLRGRRGDADERLVVRTARKLGLRVVVERAEVKQFARAQRLSLEMAAREVRHDFLARTALRLGIRTVALAHHADDQLELFFLRLLRGSGSEGLTGMKWRNSSPSNETLEMGEEAKAIKLKLKPKSPFHETRSADIPDRGLAGHSWPMLLAERPGLAIGKSPPPADRNVCATGEAPVQGFTARNFISGNSPPGHLPAQAGRGRDKVELIRPLLDLPKMELRAFATQNKIAFREDSSNSSLDIQRNRIRHELLPWLRRQYQPALDRTISRVMDIVGAEGEFVGEIAAEWLAEIGGAGHRARRAGKTKPVPAHEDARPSQTMFANLPRAVQRRCIQMQLLRQKIATDFDLVESLRLRPGRFIKVSPHLAVKLAAEGILGFQESKVMATCNPAFREVDLNPRGGGEVFSEVKFGWRVAARKVRQLPSPRAGRELFDADKVGARIVLRHWRAGDRFQPSGMASPVKLQDLFTNQKLPRDERRALIVAETAQGEIFWVERLRIAERFKLCGETNRCLQWRWKRLKY